MSKEIGAAARAKVNAGIGSSVIVRVCVAPGAEPHAETTRTRLPIPRTWRFAYKRASRDVELASSGVNSLFTGTQPDMTGNATEM